MDGSQDGKITRTWWAVIDPVGGRPVGIYPNESLAANHVAMFFTSTGAEIRPMELTYDDPGVYRTARV